MVRFFESGADLPPVAHRVYKKDFLTYQTRYISWELKLKFPTAQSRIDFNIDVVWFRQDGSILTRQTFHAYVLPGWKNSYHAFGWGNKNGGTWLPGRYHVDFYVEGRMIASSGFTVS